MLSHSSLESQAALIHNYLSRGKHNQKLHLSAIPKRIILSEFLDDWQRKGQCLTGTCPIASDEVSSLEDVLESIILNREEPFDALVLEHLDHFLILDEVRKITLLMELSFIYLGCLGVDVLQQLTT